MIPYLHSFISTNIAIPFFILLSLLQCILKKIVPIFILYPSLNQNSLIIVRILSINISLVVVCYSSLKLFYSLKTFVIESNCIDSNTNNLILSKILMLIEKTNMKTILRTVFNRIWRLYVFYILTVFLLKKT